MNTKYVMAYWPEFQKFQEHRRNNECFESFNAEINEPVLFVPEDLYVEIMKTY